MKRNDFTSLVRHCAALFMATGLASSMVRAQPILYGLTSTNSLLFIEGDARYIAPGPSLSGLGDGETAIAIDVRPLTGDLYALTRDVANQGRLYTVNLSSGALQPVPLSGPSLDLSGTVDMNFNPAAAGGTNALRIVTSDEQNYRLVFTTNGATVNIDVALNVAGGASATNVVATAYSNNRAGLPGGGGVGGTVQYAIDSETDTLYRVTPPNGGVLTGGVPLDIDIDGVAGFDIVTGTDRALVAFVVGVNTVLFELSLTTAEATVIDVLLDDVVDFAAPVPAGQPTPLIYALTWDNTLVRFSAEGGPETQGPALSGLGAGESVVGIDFRPLTGELYALTRDDSDTGRLYTVNLASGFSTPVPLSGPALNLAGSVGLDFNPAAATGVNALRILTSEERNYRLVFSASGASVNVDSPLNVPGGASGTNVIATAYSNNRAGLPGAMGAGGTVQFAIDAATDLLYRVNPPNAGALVNALPLNLDVEEVGGFDIVTGSDRALGVLRAGGFTSLYQIDLATGGAIPLRFLSDDIVDVAVPMPPVFPSTTIVGLTATNALVTFGSEGGPMVSGPSLTGLGAGELAVGIDFRPLTGELFVMTRDGANVGRIYTVDPSIGVGLLVPLSGPPLTITGSVAMDFNPAAVGGSNALRVVTSDEQNYRLVFNADGATVNVDTPLNVADAAATNVTAIAYSNNRSGLPGGGGTGGTVQYAMDSELDVLYRVVPPNGGVLTSPLPLGLDVRSVAGFDLVTGTDRALAIFDVAGSLGLYEVTLTTGASALIRTLPPGLVDLAVPTPIHGRLAGPAGSQLNVQGGIGPYAVLRADVVSEPFCSVTAIASRTYPISFEGRAGFYRLADLAGTPNVRMTVSLSGAAQRPIPVNTSADGFGTLQVSGNTLTFNIGYRGLSSPATMAHIHGPGDSTEAVGILIDLAPFNNGAFGTEGTLIGSVGLTAANKAALLSGLTYVTVHTANNPGGEIRGQISPVVYKTILTGASERPTPTTSLGQGFGLFSLLGKELVFNLSFQGLSGPLTAAHLHGPAPSSDAAGILIDLAPSGVDAFNPSGRFVGRVTRTPAQMAAVVDGKTYINLHTASFPAGEIRGQVRPIITGMPFSAELVGAAERPTPVTTTGSGFGTFVLSEDTLAFQISYLKMSGPIVSAHLHGPATAAGAAGVQFDLVPFHRGPLADGGIFSGSVALSPEQKAALLAGDFYVNLHTTANPGGEIRGQVTPVVMQVNLTGAAQRPTPVVSPATGFGYLGVLGKQLSVGLRYSGLSTAAIAAHLHGPGTTEQAVGVLIDFMPFATGALGTSGFFQGSVGMTDDQVAAVADGLTYVNVHSGMFGNGEIRGQVAP